MSREDLHFRLRLPQRIKDLVSDASAKTRRSMTAEIVSRLEHSFSEPTWPLDAPPLEGRKDDGGKARHDLLAPEYLTGTAEILAFGAAKYGARNWEKGMAWSRPFAALMRHMWAWWAGEQIDAETGKSHLWHASCCLMFLVAYEQRKSGTDDRPNSA